ncbi:unnamed protein product [Triticum turgidum subsp. durum]|uniref:Argonaute 4 n=1 Tax=Triticum turgidum subsp. durum TaxID=4567 RepID=A0A9R0QKS0_TRITD|nr:unnamed protein product [Triticum turgidum subsp. durum]
MDPHDGEPAADELPPPPPLPPNVVPIIAEDAAAAAAGESEPPPPPPPPSKPAKPRRHIMARPPNGLGKKGQPIQLLANHYKVSVKPSEEFFNHYYVNLKYEDDTPVDSKGIGRKVLDKLQHTYHSELANKDFAYDGEKSLFTIGALPQINNEFIVVLEDIGSGKTAAGSPGGNNGSPGGGDQKRVRRPYQAKTFKVELNFAATIPMAAIGHAIRGQESEHSLEALRVLDIILRQHSAKQGCLLVRQSFFHNNPSNFVDLGGGVMGCRGFHSSFRGAQSGLSLNIDVSTTMIVKPGPVIDFLLANQKVDHPDKIDWQKAKRALKNLRIKTTPANSEFKIVGLSERNCNEQMFPLRRRNGDSTETVEITVYDYFVKNRGIELRYSGNLPCINAGRPKRPTYFPVELCTLVPLQRYTKALSTMQRTSLVEKSRQKPHERMSTLNDALKRSNYDADPMLKACGISIAQNFTQIEGRVLPAPKLKAGNGEEFFTRNGRWNIARKKLIRTSSVKRWSVVNFSARCDLRGLVQDLKRVATGMGLEYEDPHTVIEESPSLRRAPVARRVDVSHGQPGQSDRPSIAAVVSSREWPLICKYRATVHTQSPKQEMMASLFKPRGTEDDGLIRESLIDFYTSSGKRKPDQVIIFRDGVSESQFTQVINIELEQIIEACKCLDDKWEPKFTVIVAQKNHHTRFFQANSPENVPPGTVVDKQVCHPKNFDFYMCAHAGMIGTSRPTHYHVLHDEIGFSGDELQEFVHSLSYVYQRSTTAISVAAPIAYAHLAAAQVGTFMKFDDMSDTSSSQGGGHTSAGSAPVPELPRLHEKVRSSMFFC